LCLFIVIEGIDGSGKTTQAKMLFKKLIRRGYRVALLAEPTGSVYGRKIREKLREGNYTAEELYELFVKDRMLNAKNIQSLLRWGYIVILDRYYISTIAYQGAQGIPIDRILNDHKNLPQPDIIIILDIDPVTALGRLKKKDTFETREFLERVREIYLRIPEILKNFDGQIEVINADRDPEAVGEDIWKMVRDRISCGE